MVFVSKIHQENDVCFKKFTKRMVFAQKAHQENDICFKKFTKRMVFAQKVHQENFVENIVDIVDFRGKQC